MSLPSDLADAYGFCEQVSRASASSFYHAFKLLDPDRRRAIAAVYAFCRFCDDAADLGHGQAALVDHWRRELSLAFDGRGSHPITLALADAVRRFKLPRAHLEAIVRGVEMDFEKRRYATFQELRDYCYHVASAVGLTCIEIFGYQEESAKVYAENLGIAFQLTNIMRDLAEDAERGRIYLPLEDLDRFGYRERDLFANRTTGGFHELMAFESRRCRAFYTQAEASLAPVDRPRMVCAEAMRLVYRRLLARMERLRFSVFGPRISLPIHEKIICALIAYLRSSIAAGRFALAR